MIDEALRKLIDFLQSASPTVWQTLMKQAYADAISDLIWAVGLGVACVFLARFGKYCHQQKEKHGAYSDWEFGVAGGYAGMALAGFFALLSLTSAIKHFYNPEFYAIRYILEQLK